MRDTLKFIVFVALLILGPGIATIIADATPQWLIAVFFVIFGIALVWVVGYLIKKILWELN